MRLESLLFALRMRGDCDARAEELAQMAYVQWLGTLAGGVSYEKQARLALQRLRGIPPGGPALRGFCALVERSLTAPCYPLPITVPRPKRRGGARARRVLP